MLCFQKTQLVRLGLLSVLAVFAASNNVRGQGAQTNKPEIVVQTGSAFPNARVVLSPDGRLLASVTFGENSIHLWDIDTQHQLRQFEATRSNRVFFGMSGISEMEFSDNGARLAATTGEEVEVWNVNDGERLYRFPLASQQSLGTSMASALQQGLSLSLSPSGRMLAWSHEGKIQVRDLANRGQEIAVPAMPPSQGDPSEIVAVAFSHDEREVVVLSGSELPVIRLINLSAGSVREVARFDRETELSADLYASRVLAVSPANEILVATKALRGTHAFTRIHNLTSGQVFDLDASDEGASISSGGATVAATAGKVATLWDIRSKQKLFSVTPDANGPMAGRWTLDISRDPARLVVGDRSGGIHVFDAQTGKEQALLVGHTNGAGLPVFDSTGTKLFSGGKTIWDLHSGIGLRTISGTVGPFSQTAANGSVYAEDAGNGKLNLWDLAAGRKIASIEARNELINGLALSPNGSLVAAVWRVDTETLGCVRGSQKTPSRPHTTTPRR